MDSVKVFKGYGKVDNIEDQSTSRQRSSRKPIITIITISAILLLTLTIGAALLALIHESNTESESSESSSQSSNDPAESIRLICNVTRYSNSCFTTISSLNTSPKPDPESILKLYLKISVTEASSISSFIKTLNSNSNPNSPQSDSALKDCQDLLEEAVSRLNESASLMEVGPGEKELTVAKIGDIQTWVSSAMTDQDTCIDGLEEMESTALIEVKSKLQRSKEYMSNTLAIVANMPTLLTKFGLTLP